ncbi:titin-like [Leguminivora glycinivorella]|uniref:titin-like n=1 Tax=Leguminivora glycinivorella TaxID=1035111 RepID=UPI00200C3F47|nr:titin-like [Leguminivora glycinivorella]
MDRLNQLRGGGAGGSRDSSLDGSGAGDSFLTANDTPSKYYSLSEDDSFDNDITKDVSLATTSAESTLNSSDCFPNLSPIGKIDYKIGKQIEAANILSGGVNIFDDNDNSYDGNELVIDDNVEVDKSPNLKSPENSTLLDNVEKASTSKVESSSKGDVESENNQTLKPPESPRLPLQGSNELSKQSSLKLPETVSLDKVDGQSMEIVQNVADEPPVTAEPPSNQGSLLDHALPFEEVASIPINGEEQLAEIANLPLDGEQIAHLDNEAEIAEANLPNDNGEANLPNDNSEENIPDNNAEEDRTEVVLQIDGNNVAAISIGTGLYLYRKEGQDELAAVQIVKEPQDEEPSFKFLKVRENAEGNLEVYEEIQEIVVVPQETPIRERPAPAAPSTSKDNIKPVVCEPSTSKDAEKVTTPDKDTPVASTSKQDMEPKETQADKTERNVNGKMVKFSESRKSPLMVHSTPNKEGIPLTKTMVDQQLHPNRHSDNIKKTIEVHTDNSKQKILESPSTSKTKDVTSPDKTIDEIPAGDKPVDKDSPDKKHISIVTKEIVPDVIEKKTDEIPSSSDAKTSDKVDVTKIKEDEAKVLMIGKLMESVKVPIAKDKEKMKKEQPGDNSKKSNIAPSTSCSEISTTSSVEISTTSVTGDNKIDEKQPLIVAQPLPTDAKASTISSSAGSLPMEIDNSIVKASISEKPEIKPLIPATEIIESDDMEVDEDVLVIEEQIIESQPEKCEPQKPEVKTVVPAVTMKSATAVNQTKNVLATQIIKPSTSIVNKTSVAESPQSGNSSLINVTGVNLTKGPNINKLDKSDKTTIPTSVKNLNTNPVKFDKPITESKPVAELKKNSFSKVEPKEINPKDTPLNHNIKIIKNELIKETTLPKDKLNQSVGKSLNVKESVKIKPTESKLAAVNPLISSAKVNHLIINNMHNKPENVPSKLELKDKTLEKKEALPMPNAKDMKTTTLLTSKEQPQSRLPMNTQSLVKPSLKSDIKPPIINIAEAKREINHKLSNSVDSKPKSINNNHAPVPFGKWTEANRQDFLNKIKESKPVNISNANQIKQPNDLNRRDVLKKIDSQRQTYNAHAKIQESLNKGNVKAEAFTSKTAPATLTKVEPKVSVKPEAPIVKPKPIVENKPEQEPQKIQLEPVVAAATSSTNKKEPRKEINNQHLIDRTIEGIINRAVTGKSPEPIVPAVTEKPITEKVNKKPEPKTNSQPTLLDAIEMKMNELHGIPFVERPPHELPRPYTESKVSKIEPQIPPKVSKIPNLLPLPKSQQKLGEGDVINLESKEKSPILSLSSSKPAEKLAAKSAHEANTSKDKVITEKEFDKFARRNSVTYEDRLTITDSHQVIQTVVPREVPPKKISRNEQMLAEAKAKSPHKHIPVKQYHPSKAASKYIPVESNKQYQSKLQLAYQTAISVSAKRRIESPITIIEDKPVKVVYLDSNVSEFNSVQLNVQGRDLSPAKRVSEPDAVTVGTGDSLDSDMLDAVDDRQDEVKTKSKHQRKQVLTPVETPDLELIEPSDLGIEVSPKKKRKTEDKPERKQNLVPKKSYLLGRSVEEPTEIRPSPMPPVVHTDAVSAIDSLVKAAELLDQSESLNASVQSVDSSQSTPVKRGRGRPRKNPLPDAAGETTVSPQKKPRLIDAKAPKHISSSDDSSDDDSMIKENWTMGKINEKIVCPICNKLFRSENVVFKHVKHCTGPSPSRSDSEKRSPRRSRLSRESETKSRDSEPKSGGSRQDADEVDLSPVRKTPSKRKSKDSGKSSSSDDVIPVEPDVKEDEPKKTEPRKTNKPKLNPRASSLVCEVCNKSFRQLSYLVSHKLQHKKEDKKQTNETQATEKSVFSCETCKKEFRKLHHLVQHRLIHNPVQSRALRKTSSEQKELPKNLEASKIDDQSAGFRCEPCDKSFRKLHHLVEHRETHDGINRQRSNSITQEKEKEKPTPPPQCDICKKTFRKLHHLIEHKEQHLETSSEKSDDQKSVKSALSTKDIIHECNLCYMVFPNEHSLNKHTVICLRKKKQSAAKQAAALEEKNAEESAKAELSVESKEQSVKEPPPVETKVVEEKVVKAPEKPIVLPKPEVVKAPQVKEDPPKPPVVPTVENVEKQSEPKPTEKKVSPPEVPTPKVAKSVETPAKVKQVDEVIVIEDTPKKKTPIKDKAAPSVTKRQKVAPPAEERIAPSSDEDEVRYMFNPDFKVAETAESKTFTKIRAKKRNSLQFEKPHKEVVRRRSLLQHPPKIPRLRAQSDDAPSPPAPKPAAKPKIEVEVPSTDSDDSDVKYSFPKTVPEKPEKEEVPVEEPKRRKTMAEKRKSLSAIAKRKSLGKAIVKPAKPSPAKPIKRRTAPAEHRCDCGQLFSSAALLARHASLAHTPPRVRRPRDLAAPSSRKASADRLKKTVKDVEQPRKSVDQVKKSVNVEKQRKSVERSRKSVDPIKKSGKDASSVELPRKSVDQVKKSAKDVSVEQKKVVSGKDSVQKSVKKTASARGRVHTGVPLPDKRPSRK